MLCYDFLDTNFQLNMQLSNVNTLHHLYTLSWNVLFFLAELVQGLEEHSPHTLLTANVSYAWSGTQGEARIAAALVPNGHYTLLTMQGSAQLRLFLDAEGENSEEAPQHM